MTSKSYEFYDIFKKSCSYEYGEGVCTKTRETKKCIDGKCEKIETPESKKKVLNGYYNKDLQLGGGRPKDELLYNSVKREASKKFKSPSGIYRSSWIVKEYKKRGGKYIGSKNKNSGLSRWFKEEWVDINRPIKNSKGKVIGYKKCGRKSQKKSKGTNYPLCRPSKRVNKSSPRTYKEISRKSLNKAKKDKKSSASIKFGGAPGPRKLKQSFGEAHYQCKTCDKSYSTSRGLKYHTELHEKQALKCQNCNYTTVNQDKYKLHFSKYHQIYSPENNVRLNNFNKLDDDWFKITRQNAIEKMQEPQEGGYYGDKKLKKSLIKNLKKRECPICKKLIQNTKSKEQHIKNHSLPLKKRKISQIDNGQYGSGKIRSQFKGTRSKIMVNVPENVKKTALYSYKLKKLEFKGGLETGWKRCKQLSTKSEIPIEDLNYMRAWFARHIYASYPSYKKWQAAGRPKTKEWHKKHGIISWLIWGGDAAFKWVNSVKNINLLNKHYPGKNYKPLKLT